MEEAVRIKRIQGNDTACLVLWTHQGHLTPLGVGHRDLQYCGFEPFSKQYHISVFSKFSYSIAILGTPSTGPWILSLKSIDYFGTSEYFSGKKTKNLQNFRKTLMVRLTGRCCKLSLFQMWWGCRFPFFGDGWNDAPCSWHFCFLGMM